MTLLGLRSQLSKQRACRFAYTQQQVTNLNNAIDTGAFKTGDSAAEYAQRVLALINNPHALAKLRAASLADADVYTLEKMVAQFADGIARCLGR